MGHFAVTFTYADVTAYGMFNSAELADRLIDILQDQESCEIEIVTDSSGGIHIPNNDFLLGFVSGLYAYTGNQLRVLTAQLNRIEIDNFRKGYFEARVMLE